MIVAYGIARADEAPAIFGTGVIVEGPLAALVGEAAVAATADPAGFMAVVDGLGERAAIIPWRASGGAADEATIRATLRSGRERFERLLSLIEGCDEWSVRVDEAEASRATAAGGGAGYLLARREAYAAADGVDPRTFDLGATIARACAGVRCWRAVAGEPFGSIATLVEREGSPATLDRVAGAVEAAGASATITGPWPAFSFAAGPGL